MGHVGCFSFYPTKNITTGDGDMVISEDRRLIRRIKILSLHGITADAWARSVKGCNGYEVVEAGFKYNMTDISATLGSSQLAQIEERWSRRKEVWQAYDDRLKDLLLVRPAPVESNTRHAYHLYTPLLALESLGVRRDKVITALRAENIGVGVHYVPVHEQPYYRKQFNFRPSDFPNASFVGQRTLSLPLAADLSVADVSDVCTALTRVLRYYASHAKLRGKVRSRYVPARAAATLVDRPNMKTKGTA
jgi:dTDP-4-amino-4,6-dideoxygalactose transaminase